METTGSNATKMALDADTALSPQDHSLYRTCVGKLKFLAPIRPDVAYAVKELASDLISPTNHSWARLRHLGRYLQGTRSYVMVVRPKLQVAGRNTPLELETYVDSDWAGCHRTRKSTMGCAMYPLGNCVGFMSKTQGLLALSSGEVELYAIGYGVMETIFLRNFIREVNLSPKVTITVYTDSAAGKSMATRYGASRRTRHCLLYTSPSPRDRTRSRMPSSA